MKTRKGLGIGMGMGYKNLVPLDPYIHSLSARGIKTWKSEPHPQFKSEKGFWRTDMAQGFVGINKVEKDAPAWNLGKYQVQVNTGFHLFTEYFDTLEKAEDFAKEWMKQHPHGNLLAKGLSTSLVVKPAKDVLYHKGLWQNVFDAKHPKTVETSEKQKLMKESTRIKKKIKKLLYDVESYKGEKARDHEVLNIVVLKDKLPHFNFLTAHTDWDATGFFKDNILDTKFDMENNAIIQIEFLDTKNEKVGKELIKSFNRLNEIEIGESLLYVRTQPLEETSLPLEQWR